MASSDYDGRVTALPRPARTVAMVTLGCARNEVDSEELAGRLAAEGYELVDDADGADAVLVNTCGFIETAKKDSVDAILAATDSGASVVAVGCMAERYGPQPALAGPRGPGQGRDQAVAQFRAAAGAGGAEGTRRVRPAAASPSTAAPAAGTAGPPWSSSRPEPGRAKSRPPVLAGPAQRNAAAG